MKRGEKKFLVVFIVLFIAYVATDFLAPKPIDWRVTFSNNDKNPLGGYILNDRSSDLFREPFEISFNTISEYDSIDNLLILSDFAEISGADYRRLLSSLESGSNYFIAANQFSAVLRDSLNFDVAFSYHILNQTLFEAAESSVQLWDSTQYSYPFSLVSNYFDLSTDTSWSVMASMEGKPIAISRSIGKGQLTLCSTPYIFTNFGLLINNNFPAAAKMLSVLPERKTAFTLFYHLGKGEATTPLRYFLRQPALRWSMYLALFCIVLFLVVTSRRTQRPIPVVTPPSNATIHYIKTLGALFYRERNHKKAASRIVSYFLHTLKDKYYLQIDYSEKFYKHLSAKSGVAINEVIHTFDLILRIRDLPVIDERMLIELTKKIEQFK